MFDLTGKSALVTGASGGIGGAIARALHGCGAAVALSGTRLEPLESLRDALGEGIARPSRITLNESPFRASSVFGVR